MTEPSVREQDLTPCLMLPVQAGVGKVDDWLSDLRGSGMLARVRRDPRGDDDGVYSLPSPARSRRRCHPPPRMSCRANP